MKKLITKLILIHLILSLLVPCFAGSTSYVLAPGDILDIQIINKKDLNTKQTVAPDGTINLQLFGRYNVEGKSLLQLQKIFEEHFKQFIQKPQLAIYLEPRPIYVIQKDLAKKTWEVKIAKSITEAKAYMGQSTSHPSPITIHHGDVVNVDIGKEPDWFEDNWYKLLTATAVILGIANSVK